MALMKGVKMKHRMNMCFPSPSGEGKGEPVQLPPTVPK